MKVACIQLNSGSDIGANIDRIAQFGAQAAAAGAQLIALPENALLMEVPGVKRIVYDEQDHPGINAVSAIAKQHRCWLLLGSVAVATDDSKKTYNRSLLFDPQGHIAARYDKIHLFDAQLPGGEVYAESARMLHGDEATLIKTPVGVIGMTICYDVRFPHLYREFAKARAQILTVPAAFTYTTGEAHWHVLLRARAIENGCFVIAPAQTGTHPGNRKTYGHSLIIDPWGVVLGDGGTDEGVVIADIDLQQVQQVRARIPSLKHDRPYTLS
jgi:deaminated glutathione amidase